MAEVTGERSQIEIVTQDRGLINTEAVGEELIGGVPVLGSAIGLFQTAADATEDGLNPGELGGIAAGAAGFVSSCMEVADVAADPIGWLVGQGLDFLLTVVQPLQDLIHAVSGDAPALDDAAGNFSNIGQGLLDYSDKFAAGAKMSLSAWDGAAAEAAARRLGEFAAGIKAVAGQAGDIAQLLKISSMIMTVIEEFIKALLTEFITWLIMIWIPALVAAVPSCGASTAAAGTATGVRAVSTGAKATKQVSKLQKLLDLIKEFIATLKDWARNLKTDFNQIMGDKQLSSVRSTLGVADGEGRLVDKLRGKGGMLGKRLLNEDGFRGAMKNTAQEAARDAVGLGDGPADTGLGLTKKAGEVADDAREASDHGALGSEQSPNQTREQLDF